MLRTEVEPAASCESGGGHEGRLAVLLLTSRDLVRVVRLAAGDRVVVGRQAPADVEIPDPSLSRRHAQFHWDGEAVWVEDLGSTNGTQVGGEAVSQAALRQGEEAHLGAVTAVAYVREVDGTSRGRAATGPVIRSSAMADLYAQVDELADRRAPVMVFGEPGVGKSLVAATLHGQGGRCRQPFRVLDCGAQGEGAIASSLFGEWDSHAGFPGELIGIQGGTLYLARVEALSEALQRRLARVLEEGRMPARPGAPPVPIEARLVLGVERPPLELLGERVLDASLYACVEDRVLSLPPLRRRTMEVRPLAKWFAQEASETWSLPCPELAEEVLVLLEQYDWPGNVRQLQEVMELLVLAGDASRIDVPALPAALQPNRTVPLPTDSRRLWPGGRLEGPALLPDEDDGKDFRTRVREYEERLILEGLRRTGGNQRATSRLLRIPLRTLAHKLKDYDLKDRI